MAGMNRSSIHHTDSAATKVVAKGSAVRRSGLARVGIIVALAARWVGSPAAEAPSASVGLTLQHGVLTNEAAHYSLTVPPEWSLREGSTPEQAIVMHEASGASLFVALKTEASGDLSAEFQGLKLALPFLGGSWHRVSDGWRRVGGKKAGEVIASRTYPNAEPLDQWNLVTVVHGRTYLLGGEVPRSQVAARWPELVAIVESITWRK